MKRKIVQHGPSTLTVSLPAKWVKDFALKKGDDISIEQMREGLFITAGKERHYGKKRVSIKGMPLIASKVIAALYKCGHDEIVVEYTGPEELERIHDSVSTSHIGFEIVDESKDEVLIKKVSEPTQEEFKTLFRRIFYFLLSTSEEGLEAARKHDKASFKKLIIRDINVNKLANFCRRVVNKRGQNSYQQDTALYHVLEQLEKIGDSYKDINKALLDDDKLSSETLDFYERINLLLKDYEDIFFEFNLAKVNVFYGKCDKVAREMPSTKCSPTQLRIRHLLQNIARELHNLMGVTMMLHL
jgi:phosphate uptake regulator